MELGNLLTKIEEGSSSVLALLATIRNCVSNAGKTGVKIVITS